MQVQLRSFLIALLALAVAGPSAFGQSGPDAGELQTGAVVKDIVFVATEQSLEVVITVMGECVTQPLVLSNPSRLVLDFAPAAKLEAKPLTEVNAFGISNIRTGMFQPMIARVIFDFGGEIAPYTLQKTAAGMTVKFTRAEPPAAKPAVPPAQDKPAPPAAKPSRPAARESAPAAAADASWPAGFYNTTFGVFGGSYSSPSPDFADIYGSDTSFQYGLNLTRTLLNVKGFQLDATFELRTYSKTGKATMSGDETKLSLKPLTIGGRILYQTKYVMPFIGFGADFYSYLETSDIYPEGEYSGSANGGHFQGGLYILFPKAEFLRLKIYYKYTTVSTKEGGMDVGLGGPEYGIGLTFGFNVLKPAVLIF